MRKVKFFDDVCGAPRPEKTLQNNCWHYPCKQGREELKVRCLPVERIAAITRITAGNCGVELREPNCSSCSDSNDSYVARCPGSFCPYRRENKAPSETATAKKREGFTSISWNFITRIFLSSTVRIFFSCSPWMFFLR